MLKFLEIKSHEYSKDMPFVLREDLDLSIGGIQNRSLFLFLMDEIF